MKVPRRHFLRLAAGAAAAPAVVRIAAAQAYPSRPVHIVVGYPAGGASDVLARVIGQWLSDRLGQPFIIDNRPGAGTNIATEAVAKSPPDGYTLLFITTANAMNATLYDRLNFNFIRDIAPAASLAFVPMVMEVNPSVPARSVPEFIAYAKANPDKIIMASAGNGGPQHVAGELFKMMTGVKMLHVPYRGSGPALTDLITDRVHVMFDLLPTSLEFIRAGRLVPLAVTTTARLEALPQVPPLADFLPGYEASAWQGLGAPRDTPPEIIEKLNTEANKGLADPKIRSTLVSMSNTAFAGTPAQFAKHIADETEKWAKVVKFASVKGE
jgi:tripartite-type tricarboxylate transporter receptor subunit TctC